MPPFHDPQRNPLPDANDIEREAADGIEPASLQDSSPIHSPSPALERDKRRLRNIFIGLVLAGLAAGSVMGIGIAIFLKRTGLADPPSPNQGSLYEHLNASGHS